jgi:WS/DGAT/MGAT family acyltransferase
MNQLSGLDAIFLHLEEAAAPMHLGAIALYDPSTAPGGTCRFERYRENVSKRLHLSPCFHRKVARVPLDADHPYWEEDAHFDLDAHLQQLALPHPGNWQQLCTAASRFHERPLDPSRPLWEMAVIEGLDDIPGLEAGAFAVVTKVHHAAIDGVAGAQLIAALHDLAPDSEPVALPARSTPTRAPGEIGRLARAAANLGRRSSELPRWLICRRCGRSRRACRAPRSTMWCSLSAEVRCGITWT